MRLPLLALCLAVSTSSFAMTTVRIVASGHLANDPVLEARAAAAGFPSGTPWSVELFSSSGSDSDVGNRSLSSLNGSVTLAGESISIEWSQYNFFEYADLEIYNGSAATDFPDFVRISATSWGVTVPGTPAFAGMPIHSIQLLLEASDGSKTLFDTTHLSDIVGLSLDDLGSCLTPEGYCTVDELGRPLSAGPRFSVNVWNGEYGGEYPGYAYVSLGGAVDFLEITAVPLPAVGWILIPVFGGLGWRRLRAGGTRRAGA
jgi:hypothetical protein